MPDRPSRLKLTLYLQSVAKVKHLLFPPSFPSDQDEVIKGIVHPKSMKTFFFFFVFPCSAFDLSRLFWCELPSFGDIGVRGVCLLLNITELDGTRLVVLKALRKIRLRSSKAMSLQ